MKLQQYLRENRISVAKFSKNNGFKAPSVSAWVYTKRIPKAKNIQKISQITQGSVTVVDWYR
jgi:hypothetical protein